MTSDRLGRLTPVDLRTIWESEASAFTPWLASEENLKILGEALGMELELEAQEKDVGPFRADILCKNIRDDQWVLVENQLERTDHTHLGQLLTYAAGLKAVTIVWIARQFTEEHRATLDWLNEITEESYSFFGVEVELWQIGNSAPAPKFNVVSKPNDWSRIVSTAAKRMETTDLSETKQLQLRYWTAFTEFLEREGSKIRPQKPRPQYWLVVTIGRSGFNLWTRFNTYDGYIGTGLSCLGTNGHAHLALLARQKDAIDTEIGEKAYWWAAGKEGIVHIRRKIDPGDETDWPRQFKWLRSKLELFERVFKARVLELDADDITEADMNRIPDLKSETEAMGDPPAL